MGDVYDNFESTYEIEADKQLHQRMKLKKDLDTLNESEIPSSVEQRIKRIEKMLTLIVEITNRIYYKRGY